MLAVDVEIVLHEPFKLLIFSKRSVHYIYKQLVFLVTDSWSKSTIFRQYTLLAFEIYVHTSK